MCVEKLTQKQRVKGVRDLEKEGWLCIYVLFPVKPVKLYGLNATVQPHTYYILPEFITMYAYACMRQAVIGGEINKNVEILFL